jgi:Lysophospholipase
MSDILVIPGIGGHPRFHQGLLDALARRHRVHTAPHGDFFSVPYRGLRAHVAHWRSCAAATDASTLVVVGISFGAQIVPDLVEGIEQRIGRIVLISPWLPNHGERAALEVLSWLPRRSMAALVRRRLMQWSEKTGDLEKIRVLRAELYDDRDRVALRWLERLLAMRSGLNLGKLGALAARYPVTLVFGRDEWLARWQKRRLAKLAGAGLALQRKDFDGRHEISAIEESPLGEWLSQELASPFGAVFEKDSFNPKEIRS